MKNVTATLSLQCELDLQKITNAYNKMCKYNKFKFVGMVMKMRAPKITLIIHRSGKVTILGNKERKIRYGVKKFVRLITDIGYKPTPTSLKICNFVMCGKFPFRLNPPDVKLINPTAIQYEPELFPGIHYLVPGTKTCVTMFVNGKFYVTGVRKKKDAQDIMDSLFVDILLTKS